MSLRMGLVGTGHWAREVHAPSLLAAPEVDFVGVFGRNVADRDQIARAAGVRSCSSYDELLASVDAVSFAVPPTVQQPLAVRAAAEGKHLLLEKPIGLAVAEATELACAVADAAVSAVVFTTRLFDADRAGWLRTVRERPWTGGRAELLTGALIPGGLYDDSRWRHESGAIWDLGPHVLSQLMPVLGRVTRIAIDFWERGGETRLRLRHESGAESSIRLTLYGNPDHPVESVEFRDADGRSVRSATASLNHVSCHGRALATLSQSVVGDAEHDVLADLGYSLPAGVAAVRVLHTAQKLILHRQIGELVPVGGET